MDQSKVPTFHRSENLESWGKMLEKMKPALRTKFVRCFTRLVWKYQQVTTFNSLVGVSSTGGGATTLDCCSFCRAIGSWAFCFIWLRFATACPWVILRLSQKLFVFIPAIYFLFQWYRSTALYRTGRCVIIYKWQIQYLVNIRNQQVTLKTHKQAIAMQYQVKDT